MTMSMQQRTVLRAKVGTAYMAVQKEYRDQGFAPEEFMPEVIATLLSLGMMLAKKSGLKREQVDEVVKLAFSEEFD